MNVGIFLKVPAFCFNKDFFFLIYSALKLTWDITLSLWNRGFENALDVLTSQTLPFPPHFLTSLLVPGVRNSAVLI